MDFDTSTPKPEEAAAYKAPAVKKRNKRMFSNLMGHLGKAKDRIAKDRSFFKKQGQVQLSASKKHKEKSYRLRNKQITVARDEHSQRLSARQQLDRKAEAVRYRLAVLEWEAHHHRMRSFLLTAATLPIFYAPKTHT